MRPQKFQDHLVDLLKNTSDASRVQPLTEAGDSPEAWIAAVISGAESPEIERIERWSTRQGEKPGNQGVTVHFHNTAKIFMRKL